MRVLLLVAIFALCSGACAGRSPGFVTVGPEAWAVTLAPEDVGAMAYFERLVVALEAAGEDPPAVLLALDGWLAAEGEAASAASAALSARLLALPSFERQAHEEALRQAAEPLWERFRAVRRYLLEHDPNVARAFFDRIGSLQE